MVLKDINEMDDEGGLRFKGEAAKNKKWHASHEATNETHAFDRD